MLRRLFSLASLLSLLMSAAIVVLWVRSYRSVQCLGYASPGHGELDVLMKEGRVAVVWGPPAEAFLGTRSIAPGTPSEPREIYIVPVRSGVVRGAGPWIVQELRTTGGQGSRGGGWRSVPPGVMPKFITAPIPFSGYPSTVRCWEAIGISYQVRLIISELPDHYPDETGMICCRELWFPTWLTAVLAFGLLALSAWGLQFHFRDRARRKWALCLTCGYSLTGNTSGTCPECGTAIPQASRPA